MRFFFALAPLLSPSSSETLTADTQSLWPVITIRAAAQGELSGLALLKGNKIVELRGTEPDFFKEFKTKLGQRRWIESDTVCFFNIQL
jgi:hypothetical protein